MLVSGKVNPCDCCDSWGLWRTLDPEALHRGCDHVLCLRGGASEDLRGVLGSFGERRSTVLIAEWIGEDLGVGLIDQKWHQPVIDGAERLRFEAVEPVLPVFAHGDEPGVAQHLQVLRNSGLAHAKGLHNARDADAIVLFGSGPREQELQNVSPGAVCDHVENVRHTHRLVAREQDYHDNVTAERGGEMSGTSKKTQAKRPLLRGLRRITAAFRGFTTSSPPRFALLVFSALVLVFTALLSLPAATADGKQTAFADALFTAVSTICVTGLSTVDMATHWSPFGRVVIFLGVNIGGLGVLTLASILGLVISKRLGLRAKLIAASDSNPLRAHGGPVNEQQTVRLGEVGQLLRTVALSALVIEVALAVLLFPALLAAKVPFVSALWEAPFYAAMAFTNTGFTPNAGGLAPFADDYFLLTVLMIGVFLGSIGFPVIYTLARHVWHVRRWSLHAKLTLITTVTLFFAGAIAFTVLEYGNPKTFGDMDPVETTFQALFLSAMTRSGGFSVIDINDFHGSSLIVGSMLMFVGGGSASTAGGIKVTTLAVLALAAWSEARGRSSVQVFGRRIPSDVQRVALSVIAWGSTIVALSTIIITQITGEEVGRVLFDVISGFGTVGLTTGVTASLPDPAVYVMAATIFMGRIGTVTLAAAVAATTRSQLYSLPVERPIVG